MTVMATPSYVLDRLRQAPSAASVQGSLPIIAFGDYSTAQVATIGINPSQREYLDSRGNELDGTRRRFATLRSLGCERRQDLSDVQCEVALDAMRHYFHRDTVYAWFRPLDRVLEGFGIEKRFRQACHLDLIQEATSPTWSKLRVERPALAQELLSQDLPFLRQQIENSEIGLLICDGRTAFERIRQLLAGTEPELTDFAPVPRLRLYRSVGTTATREITVLGWNLTMARAGLTKDQYGELGSMLAGLATPPRR